MLCVLGTIFQLLICQMGCESQMTLDFEWFGLDEGQGPSQASCPVEAVKTQREADT